MKQLDNDPWKNVEEKYKVGQKVSINATKNTVYPNSYNIVGTIASASPTSFTITKQLVPIVLVEKQ